MIYRRRKRKRKVNLNENMKKTFKDARILIYKMKKDLKELKEEYADLKLFLES